jgi:DnaJ-class molecular chaperone
MLKQRPGTLTAQDRAAFETLGLTPEATVLEVDDAWRNLRSLLHPDREGGDAHKFDLARKAHAAARFYALEPKPCGKCVAGKVEIETTKGFGGSIMKVNCPDCKGSGYR